MGIQLTFLGGASSIGASSALLEVGDKTFLIDCGVRFQAEAPLPHLDALHGKRIDAILVTHAHSDHTGGLPLAAAACPGVPIYMTPPTVDLARVLFRDALKLMDLAERESEIPLYRAEDVESLFCAIRPVSWRETLTFGEVEVRFFPASHILGAAMIHFATPSGHLLFTGDFSVTPQRTVDALVLPDVPVDVFITESTYGNRMHSDRKMTEAALVQKIASVIERKGKVLIPAFALGRAQEILLILKEAFRAQNIPDVPVFVDGMVRHMCGVYEAHTGELPEKLRRSLRYQKEIFFDELVTSVGYSPEARRKVLESGPCVVVASSGMLTGGPSAFYAREFAGREENAILISGYQDEESPGRMLLGLMKADKASKRELPLPGGAVPLRCEVGSFSLSAHADSQQILSLVERLSPRRVVLVHGDEDARKALGKRLGAGNVSLPSEGECLEMSFPKRATARGKASIFLVPQKEATSASLASREDLNRFCESNHLPHPSFRPSEKAEKSAEVELNLFDLWVAKETAETLEIAAATLLQKLLEGDVVRSLIEPQRVRLLAAHEEELKKENPKGRFLEWLAARRMGNTLPKILMVGHGNPDTRLHTGFGTFSLKETQIRTRIFSYRREKAVEAAIYRDIITAIGNSPKESSENKSMKAASSKKKDLKRTTSFPVKKEPRMWLNELRMKGDVARFSFELIEVSGPPHAPQFAMQGVATLRNGTSVETTTVTGASKKETEAVLGRLLAEIIHGKLSENNSVPA